MERGFSDISAKGYRKMITALPKVRDGLSVTELGNELIVFDTATSNAHCLDKIGSAVFLACRDGESTDSLEQKLGADYSAETVEVALAQLEELSLLEKSSEGITRRQALEAVGVAVLGVVVASVTAPSPVAAQSCVRCRLDGTTFRPCDCTTCGQICSQASLPIGIPCANQKPKGSCASSARCCFEYVKSPDGNCRNEGYGVYGCRSNTPYADNCNTARSAAAVNQSYYCCCCPESSDPVYNCKTGNLCL